MRGKKNSETLLIDMGLTCPLGYKNEDSICRGNCCVEGCHESFERPFRNIIRSQSGKKCRFHSIGSTPNPTSFYDFKKYIEINHSHLNELFIFKEQDFINDLNDYQIKLNKWKLNKDKELKDQPKRQITGFCKKHLNVKIKRLWTSWFGRNKLPPKCKNCCPHGVSMEATYIMNFLSLVLGINVRHQFNNIDGEYMFSKKPLDGFINCKEQQVFSRVEAYNNILKLKIKKREHNTSYKGFGIEYSPAWTHKKKHDCKKY